MERDIARHDADWFDAEGNPVEENDPAAVYAEITAYDADGNLISRTYAEVGARR